MTIVEDGAIVLTEVRSNGTDDERSENEMHVEYIVFCMHLYKVMQLYNNNKITKCRINCDESRVFIKLDRRRL